MLGGNSNYGDDPECLDIAEFWSDIPKDAMSGDESEHEGGERRYYTTTLPWRSDIIGLWFRLHDRLQLASRFQEKHQAGGGAWPHPRVRPTKARIHRNYNVPKGLPRNFYCDKWLAQQEEDYIEKLKIKPAMDLTLPMAYIKYVTSLKR